jgi:D-sedoheptulose 7-phosphate isomerase
MSEQQHVADDHLAQLLKRFPEFKALSSAISAAVEQICATYQAGGKILVCGNGGSASDSEHIVGELMKGFKLPRSLREAEIARFAQAPNAEARQLAARLQRGLPAISLAGHPALSTAIANDTGADMVFAQQVYVLGKPNDIFIGISTSGNSANVVNAAIVARICGLLTIGMTGEKACRLDQFSDIAIKVPAQECHRVQEYHMPIYHAICLAVEERLFGATA